MRTAAVTSLSTLTCLTVAAPAASSTAATANDFEITNLWIKEVAKGVTRLNFTVRDPDPLTNATQKCTGIWATGTTSYPQGSYEACGNSTFAWNMASWNDVTSFVLGIEHSYTDPSIGPPPWDQITNFVHANITEPAVYCSASGDTAICQQPAGQKIEARIYASIAKR